MVLHIGTDIIGTDILVGITTRDQGSTHRSVRVGAPMILTLRTNSHRLVRGPLRTTVRWSKPFFVSEIDFSEPLLASIRGMSRTDLWKIRMTYGPSH